MPRWCSVCATYVEKQPLRRRRNRPLRRHRLRPFTLCIAVDALGAERVEAVMMPVALHRQT